MRRRNLSSRLGLLVLVLPLAAAAVPVVQHVRYVSADHVYLDGGRGEGIRPGDRFAIHRGERQVAVVTVEHVATHSASCRVESASGRIRPGDRAVPIQAAADAADSTATAVAASPPARRRPVPSPAPAPEREASRRPSSWRGGLSLDWDHTDDRTVSDLDATRTTVRFRLRHDSDRGPDLEVRGSLRRIARRRDLATAPATEWVNRVTACSLYREDPDVRWHWRLGRFIPRSVPGVGYLDGAVTSIPFYRSLRIGLFAGFQPDWRTSAPRTDDLKLGGLLAGAGRLGGGRWRLDCAGIGQYHRGEISREYALLGFHWRGPRRWSLDQTVEIDMNRGWRMGVARDRLRINNLWLRLGYRPTASWRWHLAYDDRHLPRTWETRSLADSLFDNSRRRGARLGFAWRGNRSSLSADGGVRDFRRGRDRTLSYRLSWTRRGLLGARTRLRLSVSGFDGELVSGWHPSLSLELATDRGDRLELAAGRYAYRTSGLTRRDRWLRAGWWRPLPGGLDVRTEVEYDRGDSMEGLSLRTGLAYRF